MQVRQLFTRLVDKYCPTLHPIYKGMVVEKCLLWVPRLGVLTVARMLRRNPLDRR